MPDTVATLSYCNREEGDGEQYCKIYRISRNILFGDIGFLTIAILILSA